MSIIELKSDINELEQKLISLNICTDNFSDRSAKIFEDLDSGEISEDMYDTVYDDMSLLFELKKRHMA